MWWRRVRLSSRTIYTIIYYSAFRLSGQSRWTSAGLALECTSLRSTQGRFTPRLMAGKESSGDKESGDEVRKNDGI